MLGLGEAAPTAAPVTVAIDLGPDAIRVDVDGQQHELSSQIGGHWRAVDLEQPGPLRREYQIDGSDTTATQDRQPRLLETWLSSPLYRIDAWLRDEASYSRWDRVSAVDAGTGSALPRTGDVFQIPTDAQALRIRAGLTRPEAAARIWLLSATNDDREGLELDRDRRNARWVYVRGGQADALPRWFFPEQPWPFAAELLHLLGRSAMAGFVLLAWGAVLGRLAVPRRLAFAQRAPRAAELLLPLWLLAAAFVSVQAYHQLPHILDAVSYTFQAGVFDQGALWLAPPPLGDAFKGPFEVVFEGRWFSQYPPGAPAAYALGRLVGLDWLIGPLACAALIGTTAWTARTLDGPSTGLVVLLLGALSPFVLFQAGSFLSHPIAGGMLACALAAFVQGERTARLRWVAGCGALLGLAFLAREAAALLFALPLGVRLLARRRWRALGVVVAAGVPFLALYLAYNAALTGSPWTLPRTLFNPTDQFGFGDGIGFHGRHTLAAGLVNTDEQLTLLQFDALGWPPLATFGLLLVPLLVRRFDGWTLTALGGFLAFVAAYAGYFYDGVALGPRYYFEAMPWLLLLVGRGAQAIARLGAGRLGAGVVLGVLSLNALLFYLPNELTRRVDFSGLPDAAPLRLAFVRTTPLGPRLDGVPSPALVVTDDWWLYNTSLAALNCASVPDCPVVFALATSSEAEDRLRAQFPERQVLHATPRAGLLVLT